MPQHAVRPASWRPAVRIDAASIDARSDPAGYRKRRRVELRHETAAVMAEIRRMRRHRWTSIAAETFRGRLAS